MSGYHWSKRKASQATRISKPAALLGTGALGIMAYAIIRDGKKRALQLREFREQEAAFAAEDAAAKGVPSADGLAPAAIVDEHAPLTRRRSRLALISFTMLILLTAETDC